ncbi:thiol reductant ABC exporter subunit CydC [Aureimonas altamirensis]|uniref:thiol reductant ABC exporter subunit CydC n=1 Tax=Aureimonas altamirensis TaxID=370622 RepID=UPI002036F678|nr:thiol reductant ABC exporter subunit CydC [Aureimonas altamirensis]MCM2503951.1 thiol reductant ABC exporter subunit CydC [Aureimonas altamirensis]
MRALLSFTPLFVRHYRAFALALLMALATVAAGVGLLAVSGWFLTAAFLAGAGAAFNLFGPSSAVRGLSLLRILCRYGERMSGHDATLKALTQLRHWLFTRLVPNAGPLGKGLRRGDLIQRLTADVDALDVVFLLAIGPMATAFLAGSVLSVVFWFVLPGAALGYLAAFMAAAIAVPLLLTPATRRAGRDAVEAMAALRMMVLDGVDGRSEILCFGCRDRFMERFDTAAAALGLARTRIADRAAFAQGSVQALTGAALLLVLVPGMGAVSQGQLGGAALAGLLLAVLGTFETTAILTRSVARLGAAATAAERLNEIARPMEAAMKRQAGVQNVPDGDLRFVSAVAGYRGASPVGPLDLTVRQGGVVAIKGPSGSGKSTLLASVLQLAPLRAGRISIGGVPIEEASQQALYARVALLEQEAPIFLGTLRDNLLLADPDATDRHLWGALADARLEAMVRALPGGLDTEVGEAGHALSAGERRRLALARILMTKATILLLDEPTSGLDAETEATFFSDIRRACRGRTVVIATHAELPAGAVDRVLTLNDGLPG